MVALIAWIRRLARQSPLDFTLWVGTLVVTGYVLFAPFFASRYPPITDLPFHTAESSIFRHYWDSSFHFREQFALRPLAVPYVSFYALAAVLMLVLPTMLSVKIAAAVMLGLIPAGLAVMFHGMKKSPLLGLLGVGLCWGNLTHWGFINFMAALGLFAMSIGMTLLTLDKPTYKRQLGLGLTLVALYFTHVFRFPFALAAVAGTTIVMLPATRRVRPVILPFLVGVGLFVLWWKIRPLEIGGSGLGAVSFHQERFAELFGVIVAGFHDRAEKTAFCSYFGIIFAVAIVCAVSSIVRRIRTRQWITFWDVGITIVPLACAAVFFTMFLVLPLWIGSWFYVYPREATSAAIIALGLCPDLPRLHVLRAASVVAMAVGAILVGNVVTKNYAQFSSSAEEFHAIAEKLPQASKLFYLIFEHGGSTRIVTPYIHLPAYIQAEKGGFLGWHMAIWGAGPLHYRPTLEPGAVVPTPMLWGGWEWSPKQFKLHQMGPWYDWFLVRQRACPDDIFQADPTIQRVEHIGTWWLYKRTRPVSQATPNPVAPEALPEETE